MSRRFSSFVKCIIIIFNCLRMTSTETLLCRELVNEHFGDIVAKVAYYLCCNSWQPLRFIIAETNLKANQVKKSLCVLIQHKLVGFDIYKKRIQYKADVKRILNLIYYPRIIYIAKLLFGDEAEHVMKEILQHGIVLMSVTIGRVVKKLQSDCTNDDNKLDKLVDKVQHAFKELVHTHFLKREGLIQVAVEEVEEENESIIPKLGIGESDLFRIPEVSRSALKRQISSGAEDEPPTKRLKTSDEGQHTTGSEDEGIYWTVNIDRFEQYFRDLAIVEAVKNKHGADCGEIVRAMLRISEVTTSANATTTQVVSPAEIFRSLPHGYSIKVEHINQHLRLLTQSEDRIVELNDEGGSGGSYIINFKNAATALATASILSYVQERFGRKSCRIFRLVMLKKHLEQKQVEDFAMIPSKEVKECLYQMLAENVLVMQEIPRTPDHAPSRTFYLFSVNITRLSRMLLLRSYKIIFNLIVRLNCKLQHHTRLLYKQGKASHYQKYHGKDTRQEELDLIITPLERNQIAKHDHCVAKLRSGQLQVSETVFDFDSYLKYVLVPPG